MPHITSFGLFLSAAFLLSITPGPGILYVLSRSLHGGRREGILSCFGTFIGGMVHVVAAALGLSAIVMTSAIAFSIIKYAGAAYLVYLGLRMLLERQTVSSTDRPGTMQTSALRQGIVTEVLNPKTALFFLAFIPQFVDPASSAVTQFLLLGTITASLNFTADLVVVSFAGPIGQAFQSHRRFRQRQQVFSGCTMIGLGAYVALADQK